MVNPVVGKPAPDFELPATGGRKIKLSDFQGRANVVLYFYPRDNTPGCTSEGRDFRDFYPQLNRLDTRVFGISRDSLGSHENFKTKHDFPFELLSDEDETVCLRYDVIRQKNMYGKKVRGIERSTFLIDREGILRREWRKVKVAGHLDEVLAAVESL